MNTIAVKFFVKQTDIDDWDIIDTGRFSIDEWNAFKLFSKVYERSNDEPCDMTEEEFNECYEVRDVGDVIVIIDVDGTEETAFIQA